MIDLPLKMLPLGLVLFVLIGITRLSFETFIQHVSFIETHTTFLQFLEVSDVVETFEDVISKFPHMCLLFRADFSEVFQLTLETLLTQNKIFNDEGEIFVDTAEVLHLLPHSAARLLELLDVNFSRPDITFKLLDLIIEDKLEFL